MTNLNQNSETNNLELSIEILKALALMQYNGEDFFILNNTAYEGTKEDAETAYNDELHEMNDNTKIDFETWCNENLTEVAPYYDNDYSNDYLVLEDDEADEKVKEYIKYSLWAFTPSFLSERTGLDIEVFKAIQDNGKCESNNDTILNLVEKLDNLDDFVQAAISVDGRGHFLSFYDSEENETTVNETTFYIYRQN